MATGENKRAGNDKELNYIQNTQSPISVNFIPRKLHPFLCLCSTLSNFKNFSHIFLYGGERFPP